VSYQDTPEWFSNFQEYSFILFWMIVTFLWIIYAIMLFATYWVTSNRTKTLQRNVITLLRKIDFNDNELLENSRANIQSENAKRNDMIQILNEYGIYFMNYGLTENEITRFKTRSYKGTENGNTRCVIWINDFHPGERVRVYPGCEHIYHLKCSQLWLEIEGTCPICFNTPKDLTPPADQVYQTIDPGNGQLLSIMDILSSSNNPNMSSPLQIPFNQGDQEIPRRQNENLLDNNLREPLLSRNL
jgi:hypothetical protein